jgi:hypothetical protein
LDKTYNCHLNFGRLGKHLKNYSIPFIEQIFRTKYFGKSNRNIVPEITNSKLSQNAIDDIAVEQLVIYGNIYGDFIKPVSGFKVFYHKTKEAWD